MVISRMLCGVARLAQREGVHQKRERNFLSGMFFCFVFLVFFNEIFYRRCCHDSVHKMSTGDTINSVRPETTDGRENSAKIQYSPGAAVSLVLSKGCNVKLFVESSVISRPVLP